MDDDEFIKWARKLPFSEDKDYRQGNDIESMKLEEFQEFCRKFDENFKDKIVNFEIMCKKCGSKKIHVLYDGKEMHEGSEYTGVYTGQDANLVFKCEDCGKADILIGENDV